MAIFFLNLHVTFTKSFFLKKYETLFQIKHKIHQEKVQDWSAVNKICNLLLVSNQVFLGCVRTTIENSIHLVIDQVELDVQECPCKKPKCQMPFYCYICLHRRILVGFFSKFKNNYSVKNTPTWSKFQLDLHIILYFMTYPYIRFELECVQLLQSKGTKSK